MVALSVLDDAVLHMKEKRLWPIRLPVMQFLEHEVDHLEDPNAFLWAIILPCREFCCRRCALTEQEMGMRRLHGSLPPEESAPGVEAVTAVVAADLLLGTQGWRRFAYVNPEEFLKKNESKGQRMMAAWYKVRPGWRATPCVLLWRTGMMWQPRLRRYQPLRVVVLVAANSWKKMASVLLLGRC